MLALLIVLILLFALGGAFVHLLWILAVVALVVILVDISTNRRLL